MFSLLSVLKEVHYIPDLWAEIAQSEEGSSLRRFCYVNDDTSGWVQNHERDANILFRSNNVPNATVLAEPAACTHRRSISSQYADVGVSARPTHDSASSVRQAMNESRRPYLSAKVPQNVGAEDEMDQSL